MSPEKQQLLYDRYPVLFRERSLPMSQTCMCWGIECGGGWFDILDTMCKQLDAVRAAVGVDVAFQQVKAKFGGLRVYRGPVSLPEGSPKEALDIWADIVDAIIFRAEHRASYTCEETGEHGELHASPSGWFRTLSAAKAKELGYLTPEEWRAKRDATEVPL